MPIRSTFVFWSQALAESERVLEDLSRFTKVNTIELGSTFSTSGLAGGTIPAGEGQRSVVSSTGPFGGLRIAAASPTELKRMQEFIALAESRGFKIACNFPSLYVPSRGKLSMACINIRGGRVDPPLSPPQPLVKPAGVYGCPNNPDVVEFSDAVTREIVKSWAPAGIIMVNHVEFPLWPGRKGSGFLLEDLFSCFCPHCERRAIGEGLDFSVMKKEASSLYEAITTKAPAGAGTGIEISANFVLNWLARRPALLAWLRFRTTSMTDYVRSVVKAGREAAKEHNPKLQLGLEFQIPALSPLLGTDFVELSSSFDFLVPKFPDYVIGNTIPILSDIIAAKTGAAKPEEIGTAIRELLDLGRGPARYTRRRNPTNMLYDVPFEMSIIDRQVKYLAPVLGKVPLHPYLWLEEGDANLLREKLKTLKKNGLDGYFLWQWERDLTPEALRARKGIY